MNLVVAIVAIILGFLVSYFWYKPYVVTMRGLVSFFLILKERKVFFFTEDNRELSSYQDFEKFVNDVIGIGEKDDSSVIDGK